MRSWKRPPVRPPPCWGRSCVKHEPPPQRAEAQRPGLPLPGSPEKQQPYSASGNRVMRARTVRWNANRSRTQTMSRGRHVLYWDCHRVKGQPSSTRRTAVTLERQGESEGAKHCPVTMSGPRLRDRRSMTGDGAVSRPVSAAGAVVDVIRPLRTIRHALVFEIGGT
jgi:hypothetical protein